MRKIVKVRRAVWMGALLVSGFTVSACSRCGTLDGMPIDAKYSFDLLRPGRTSEEATEGGLPSRIRVFSENNVNWDMDAACRTASLTHVGELHDPTPIREFIDALRRDVSDRDLVALSPDCRDAPELYHIFLLRPGGAGYILLRRCRAADGTMHGRLTNFNADGDVSIRAGTETVRMIEKLPAK